MSPIRSEPEFQNQTTSPAAPALHRPGDSGPRQGFTRLYRSAESSVTHVHGIDGSAHAVENGYADVPNGDVPSLVVAGWSTTQPAG